MPSICIANQKGGVGKSTTAINLSFALGLLGKRVLVIDCDPQANTTSSLLRDMGLRDQFSLVNALNSETENTKLSSMALPSANDNVDIVPNLLSCLEWERKAMTTPDTVLGLQRVIKNDVGMKKYNFILLDTPPNLGVMMNNSLMISDYVIVPIPVSDQYAIDGFSTFLKLMRTIKNQNENLKLLGVLLTKFDARAVTYRKNKEKIINYFSSKGINVFKSIIRINVDLTKAAAKRRSIFELAQKKPGALDYKDLANEVIKLTKE